MFISPSMALTIWSNSSDPYSHNDLANNFLKLDQHDHSGGRGIQISTAGIANNAVTTAKIAPGSVGAAQLTSNALLPAGLILPYAGGAAPGGYLIAQGQLISRSTYSNLFAAIGTNWGSGDGITTFALPNAQDCFLIGAGLLYPLGSSGGEASVTLSYSNMPSHDHGGLTGTGATGTGTTGGATGATQDFPYYASAGGSYTQPLPGGFYTATGNWGENAVLNVSVGGASIPSLSVPGLAIESAGDSAPFTNLPPYCSVNYIIKY
jgi:microcystin-dependent protein